MPVASLIPSPISSIAASFDHASYARWIAQVANHLDRATACDDPAGTVTVAFRLDRDGRMSDLRVMATSGDAAIDERAIARLRAIGRLPSGPIGAMPRTQMVTIGMPASVAAPTPEDRAAAAALRRRALHLAFA